MGSHGEHTVEETSLDCIPTMTEDLWHHALRFLDRYRTDYESHDISELYEFADKTGVLDRHRQLLSQPFNENRVRSKEHNVCMMN